MKNKENCVEIECFNCKNKFKLKNSQYKWKKNKGQKTFYCSIFCASKVTRILSSQTQKGKPKQKSQGLKISENAKTNPSFGFKRHKHKKESCDKISENLTGRIFTEKHKENLSEALFGRSNPNYIDGRSYEPYCLKFNFRFKEDVRLRDSHICQLCRIHQSENGQRLDVHHIHYDKKNCEPDCVSLCIRCNRIVNYNRNYYERLFMNQINDRQLLLWSKYRNDKNVGIVT